MLENYIRIQTVTPKLCVSMSVISNSGLSLFPIQYNNTQRIQYFNDKLQSVRLSQINRMLAYVGNTYNKTLGLKVDVTGMFTAGNQSDIYTFDCFSDVPTTIFEQFDVLASIVETVAFNPNCGGVSFVQQWHTAPLVGLGRTTAFRKNLHKFFKRTRDLCVKELKI